MMRLGTFATCLVCSWGFLMSEEDSTIRCMIQMKNYEGEGAYIVTGLIDDKG